MTRRPFFVLLGLAVFLMWAYMLVHSVRIEEREAVRQEFMLDDSGRPVEVTQQVAKSYRLQRQEASINGK